jgi:pimeloyl-ACP methyl ester carboxylesterase
MASRELTSSFRLIGYRRRGYGASTGIGTIKPIPSAFRTLAMAILRHPWAARPFEPLGRRLARLAVTIAQLAGDAAGMLGQLGVTRAHLVGHSLGGVIALQLARDRPDLVQTLVLLEPALPMVPGARQDTQKHVVPAVERYLGGDKEGAVDIFLGHVFGQNWRSAVEVAIPGASVDAIDAADTFFRVESPALGAWRFGDNDATFIEAPVLSVVGSDSPGTVREGRALIHRWFGTQVEDFDLPRTNHLLQIQNSKDLAVRLAEFFHGHRI